ncbi:MAG: TetR family transcriptional regulator [Pseudonocardia sp. SCN 72-86]|nr:MAG: TetR family transcriptional regulator [Pseudonocardia sp. SCN 72-86]
MSTEEPQGLRERKKVAMREALAAAALRLAQQHGVAGVRVDDIADAAGVSPRTYNNYFSSREQAIVSALAAERSLRIGAALGARPAGEPLSVAVVEAVVSQYDEDPGTDVLGLLAEAPALHAEYLESISALEAPLAAAVAERGGTLDDETVAVLAAAVAAAARSAASRWLTGFRDAAATGASGLVAVTTVDGGAPGSLAEAIRAALAVLSPALAALDG